MHIEYSPIPEAVAPTLPNSGATPTGDSQLKYAASIVFLIVKTAAPAVLFGDINQPVLGQNPSSSLAQSSRGKDLSPDPTLFPGEQHE